MYMYMTDRLEIKLSNGSGMSFVKAEMGMVNCNPLYNIRYPAVKQRVFTSFETRHWIRNHSLKK